MAKLLKSEVKMEQELATSDESLKVAQFLKKESERLGVQVDIVNWALI